METVNNMASAASKAIWGDQTKKETPETAKSNEEPISGATGDVNTGEPYDKGNLDSASTGQTTGTTPDPTPDPTTITTTTTPMPSAAEPASRPSDEPKRAQTKNEGAGLSTLQDESTGRPPATDAPHQESQGTGTSEKNVKSSGVKAEGGDFDAANPGAGKEAARLLEQKGVQHTTPDESAKDDAKAEEENGSDSKGEKPSLKEKIKAKLHRRDKNKSDS